MGTGFHNESVFQSKINHNGIRVYIAKITFTTLIDHFTSVCRQALVYSPLPGEIIHFYVKSENRCVS